MERLWRCVLPAVQHHCRCINQSSLINRSIRGLHPRTLSLLNVNYQTENGLSAEKETTMVVNERIRNAESVTDLLDIIDKETFDVISASQALSSLAKSTRFSKENLDTVSKDRLQKLFQAWQAPSSLPSSTLVATLNSLLILNLHDDEVIQPLVKECQSRMREMQIFNLVQIVANTSKLKNHPDTLKLARDAFRLLELRWKEIKSHHAVKILLKTALHLSPVFAEKLEDKTLGMMDVFSFEEIVMILKCFQAANRRSLIMLRTISTQILEHEVFWDVKSVIEIMNTMGRLSYSNAHLFSMFAAYLQRSLNDCSPSDIADISWTFGLHLHHDKDLFKAIVSSVEARFDEFTLKDLKKILVAMCEFKIQPSRKLISHLQTHLKNLDFESQLDVALSLAIFKALTVEILSQILEDAEVPVIAEETHNSFRKMKLLQLNALARYEYPDFKGPLLPPTMQLSQITSSVIYSKKFQKSVVDTLHQIIPVKKFIKSNVLLNVGYNVDVVLFVNENREFLSPDEYVVEEEKFAEDPRKVLPQGASKVAVVSMGPSFFIAQKDSLSGRRELMVRILQLAGWKVVQIPYKEWSEVMFSDRGRFLQSKLEGQLGFRIKPPIL